MFVLGGRKCAAAGNVWSGEDEDDDDDDAEEGRKVGRSTRDISDLPRSVGRPVAPSRIILFPPVA